jgi:sec-independent protein translocase protein TatB
MFSIPHMIVLFVVVLVVFGPQKLPELARGLGKLMAEFRKASTDFKSAFEEEMREMERQALQAERRKAAEAAAASAATVEATQASATPPALTEGVVSPSETPSVAAAPDGPVITPVTESVPRSPEESVENQADTAAVAGSQEFPLDHQHPS